VNYHPLLFWHQMSTTTCPVLRPTLAEFSNFRKYLKTVERYMESGICKVIPPAGWYPREYSWDEIKSMTIATPISQLVSRTDVGVYNLGLVEAKNMTVEQYKQFCDKNSYDGDDMNDRERKFWRSMGFNGGMDDPMYGADMVGSLFGDDEASSWNVNHLDTPLQLIGNDLPGVSNSMLYFGSWRAMFAFHTEDMELFSINFVHLGAPKSWYSIPPKHKKRFENAAQAYFPVEYRECREFLRHKLTMISPNKLKALGIEYNTVVQQPGEFVITFPGAYHAGFNHGFNIAEATNFATEKWIEIGRTAKSCSCNPDSVRIDMDVFETLVRRDKLLRRELDKFPPAETEDKAETVETLDAVDHSAEEGGDGAVSDSECGGSSGEGEGESSDDEMGWLLRCSCGKRKLYEATAGAAEGLVYLCAECGVWSHAACNYGHSHAQSADDIPLPSRALCHLCERINASHYAFGADDGAIGMSSGGGSGGEGCGSESAGGAIGHKAVTPTSSQSTRRKKHKRLRIVRSLSCCASICANITYK
jgi:[histone H3]-trimethyl-L-lysine9/36 demethylase